jgi:uncharacterized protein YjbJ (UPF0337 family)
MENENQVPKGGDEQSLGGKVKEVAGWATGDRDVEAEGRADGDGATSVDDVAEDVRVEHGDKGVTAQD